MRRIVDGEIDKTGKRKQKPRPNRSDEKRIDLGHTALPSVWVRPIEAEEIIAAVVRNFLDRKAPGDVRVHKELSGMAAGLVARAKQSIASNRRTNMLARDGRRGDKEFRKSRSQRRAAKRRAAKK